MPVFQVGTVLHNFPRNLCVALFHWLLLLFGCFLLLLFCVLFLCLFVLMLYHSVTIENKHKERE